MQRQPRHAISRPRHRRGLAPLEFVLALPLMLFVMALIINIGSVGAWKVREQANVRNASWRTLYRRTGDSNPNPPMWPSAAPLNGGTGNDLVGETFRVWNGDPDLTTPAVRGGVIEDPNSGMAIYVNRKLEMTEGVHDGRAPLERTIPLLRGILPDNGAYRFDVRQNVLDGTWDFQHLGYGHNRDRRARLLYEIEPEDFFNVIPFKVQLKLAAATLANNSLSRDLMPLDRDDEFIRYTGSAPDFYPRIAGLCVADPTVVRLSSRYRSFLRSIERRPGVMGRSFRDLYQAEIDRLEALDPPPPGVETLIAELQEKIRQLNSFLGGLGQQYR